MAGFNGKFESAKQEWETPSCLFEKLNKEFEFDYDLAANKSNAKCLKFYNEDNDAMLMSWRGRCWLNPPYGKKRHSLKDWVVKASTEGERDGVLVVMLIPARTNTSWWHDYCMKAKEVRFICGRPKFGDAQHGLPQPLALIIFEKHNDETKYSSFYL